MKKSIKILIAAIIAITAVFGFVSCKKTSSTNSVSTDGSTSMEKMIGVLGEAFQVQHPAYKFTYNPTGSGTGIQAVLDDRCDIGLSSRSLKNDEVSQGLTQTIVAYDGIALIVNNANAITNLTLDEIEKIYTGKITDWQDVGGTQGSIVVVGREAGSGTRDGFESVTNTKNKCVYRQELTSTGDVITTVANNPLAIGYASLASVSNKVKTVSVDSITPSEETVKDGSYSLQRPFVFVTKTDKALTSVAQEFFDFAISSDDLIKAAGVVPAK